MTWTWFPVMLDSLRCKNFTLKDDSAQKVPLCMVKKTCKHFVESKKKVNFALVKQT